MPDSLDNQCRQRNYIRLPHIKWNSNGKIVNITFSLARICGFQSVKTFKKEFKRFQEFILYPDWESFKHEINTDGQIKDFPLCTRSANSSLMMLEAELRISEDKNYEAIIKIESDSFYKSIFDNAIDGSFVSTPDGKFLQVNPKLVEIYGYKSTEEMLEVDDIALAIYHKPQVRRQLMKTLELGNPIENFQFLGKRKDNRLILVSKNVYPVHRQGKLRFLFGYVKDISESTENIDYPVPVFKCDFDGHIIYSNKAMANWLGYSREEILNINIGDLYHKPYERKDWLRKLKKRGRLYCSPRHLKNKNGEYVKVFVDVVVSTDINGNPLYIKGWLSDQPGGNVKLPWIESLKEILRAQKLSSEEQVLTIGVIKRIAREKSIIDDLSEEEIHQIVKSINNLIEESKKDPSSPKKNNPRLSNLLAEKEYSLEEKIELDIWHFFEFLSRQRKMLKDALNISQVSILLDTSGQDIIQKLKDKTLLAVHYNGEYHFPIWQFDRKQPNGIVDKLSNILIALEMSDIERLCWLTSPNEILEGRKPSNILRNGSQEDKQRVVEESYGIGRC